MSEAKVAKMSKEQMEAEIQRLLKQNEALSKGLKEPKERSLLIKVSQKGAVSVYGLGRFPVTLYSAQWTKLFSIQEEIKGFIKENDSLLAKKADKTEAPAQEAQKTA